MVKSDTGKGEVAEEVLAEYFRAAGFFAVRGIPFRHEGADLTDLDVWLYERGAGASRRRFIVDSKNKKTPKVAERIFWTSGLRDALELDGAYVASTSPKEETRKLARRVNISLIDVTALTRGAGFDPTIRLAKEDIDRALAQLDREHESKKWRATRDEIVASVIMGFGGGTANVALRSAKFFAEQAQVAASGSTMRELAQRMFYFALSFAAIALDYVAAKSAFQPIAERRSDLEDVLRFGTDPEETKKRLTLALDLIRGYLPSGSAAANQLRAKVEEQTRLMPVDIIADVVLKMAGKGQLFEAARVLERTAHDRAVLAFSDLGVDVRSFVGAAIDYLGLDRVILSNTFGEAAGSMTSTSPVIVGSEKTLFDDTKK